MHKLLLLRVSEYDCCWEWQFFKFFSLWWRNIHSRRNYVKVQERAVNIWGVNQSFLLTFIFSYENRRSIFINWCTTCFPQIVIFNLTLSRHDILYLFASTGNMPVFFNPVITFSTVRPFFQILAIRLQKADFVNF